MKGWKLTKPFELEEQEIIEKEEVGTTKIKLTKALISLADVLRFNGEIDCDSIILGSSGIGIISDTEANLFGLEKGKRVYVNANKFCEECYECKSGDRNSCSNLLKAGEDYDGFLRDFISTDSNEIFILPDSVHDLEALFIEQISLATEVVDKLNIQAGDYVSIIGANNFGNILAQLLIYYQAVPIVLTNNAEDYKIAKESGIYYVLNQEDNWQKEVSSITSGRMTKSVVYIADCNISATKAFALASHNAGVAFTGISYKNTPIPFSQAIKKQLNIRCIDNGFKNTASSINLIANKAIDLSHLKIDTISYSEVPKKLKEMSSALEKEESVRETIVELI